MESIKVNSVLKLYTLCLLNNGPKHGYEIMKELETSMDKKISASHIYPFLKTLEKKEVISCKCVEQREKKKYELTEGGKDFIDNIFGKLNGMMETLLENKITTCPHCNCKIYESGHVETINNEENTFCCPHCANAYKNSFNN
jgi:DNA-binding PadR family transcriptional regulator